MEFFSFRFWIERYFVLRVEDTAGHVGEVLGRDLVRDLGRGILRSRYFRDVVMMMVATKATTAKATIATMTMPKKTESTPKII